jgi:hypothetical protein
MTEKPKEDVREVPRDVLSRLPSELLIQVAQNLQFSDLCHVRATCRASIMAYVDPIARLIQDLADGWAAVERAFTGKYIITFDMKLKFFRNNGQDTERKVRDFAIRMGLTNLVINWISKPDNHHFPCSICLHIKSWADFPIDKLRQTYPFTLNGDAQADAAMYKNIPSNLKCGACIAEQQPYVYHTIDCRMQRGSVIKCHRCHLVKKAERDIGYKSLFSGYCQDCFMEVNKEWFDYKHYLENCLATMDRFEKDFRIGTWHGLPQVTISDEFLQSMEQGSSSASPLADYLTAAGGARLDGQTGKINDANDTE